MGELSQTTVRRLYVLALVAVMPDGVWGRLRLQKMNFFAERESKIRPFAVIRGPYGQFSDELADTVEQLLAAKALMLTTRYSRETGEQVGANEYRLADAGFGKIAEMILAEVAPSLYAGLADARKYGLLPEHILREEAYKFFDNDLAWGIELLSAYVPERFEVKSLENDELDDLEMSLDPTFVQAMLHMESAFAESKIDREKVRVIGDLRALAARESA